MVIKNKCEVISHMLNQNYFKESKNTSGASDSYLNMRDYTCTLAHPAIHQACFLLHLAIIAKHTFCAAYTITISVKTYSFQLMQ